MRYGRVAGPALTDVVGSVSGARDEVVVDRPVLAVLRIDAVAADVPRGQVRRAEAVGRDPVERVAAEVVRRHIEDRHACGANDDPVAAPVIAGEHDGVTVGAHDRQIVLRPRDHISARIHARREHDRVAGVSRYDRLPWRRHILRDADLRSLQGMSGRDEHRHPDRRECRNVGCARYDRAATRQPICRRTLRSPVALNQPPRAFRPSQNR